MELAIHNLEYNLGHATGAREMQHWENVFHVYAYSTRLIGLDLFDRREY